MLPFRRRGVDNRSLSRFSSPVPLTVLWNSQPYMSPVSSSTCVESDNPFWPSLLIELLRCSEQFPLLGQPFASQCMHQCLGISQCCWSVIAIHFSGIPALCFTSKQYGDFVIRTTTGVLPLTPALLMAIIKNPPTAAFASTEWICSRRGCSQTSHRQITESLKRAFIQPNCARWVAVET